MPDFYGLYKSSYHTCRQELLTAPQTVPSFAAQGHDPVGPKFPDLISYECPRCGEDHVFKCFEVYQVSSPRMRKLFLRDADAKGIELHVELPI